MPTPPPASLTNAITAAVQTSTSDPSYWVNYTSVNGNRVATAGQSSWDFLTLSTNAVSSAPGGTFSGLKFSGTSLTLPGAALVNVRIKNNYKRAKAQNQDVATQTDIGRDPHELDIIVRFTGSAAFQQWVTCVKQLNFAATGTARPVYGINHQKAALYGIQFVVLDSLDDPPEDASRVKQVRMRMSEWTQPVPTVAGKPTRVLGQTGTAAPQGNIKGAILPPGSVQGPPAPPPALTKTAVIP